MASALAAEKVEHEKQHDQKKRALLQTKAELKVFFFFFNELFFFFFFLNHRFYFDATLDEFYRICSLQRKTRGKTISKKNGCFSLLCFGRKRFKEFCFEFCYYLFAIQFTSQTNADTAMEHVRKEFLASHAKLKVVSILPVSILHK